MRTFNTYGYTQIPEFAQRPYVYKNVLLLMASDWFLDKKVLKLINEAVPAVERFEKNLGFKNPEKTKLKSLIEQDGQYKVNEAQEINNAFGKQLNVVKLKIEAFKMTKEIPTRKELFLPNKTKKG